MTLHLPALSRRPRTDGSARGPVDRDRRRIGIAAALLAAAILSLAQPMQAQQAQGDGCTEPGMNGQCTEFGAIVMETQHDIRGEPIHVPATIVLNTVYEDQAARWLLFSARSLDGSGPTPVTLKLSAFTSDYGDIVTTKVEQPNPGEINLWVDTLDTPLGTPITLDLEVGAEERGAYRLETLVMAFDRGYTPVQDSLGNDASLYSFTLIGVNGESGGDADRGFGKSVPAVGMVPLAAALAAALALLRRRCA